MGFFIGTIMYNLPLQSVLVQCPRKSSSCFIHARMKFSAAKLKVNLAVSNPFLLLFDAIKASTPA